MVRVMGSIYILGVSVLLTSLGQTAWARELHRSVNPRFEESSLDTLASHPGAVTEQGRGIDRSVDWTRLLDQDGGSAVTFGAKIMGPQPYERNPGRLFAPASVTKVFTTSSALELLGPDHRFETQIEWKTPTGMNSSRAADLTIYFEGDPSWGMRIAEPDYMERPRAIARAIYDQGVRDIFGGIQVTARDARWLKEEIPPGWAEDDLQFCYGAPLSYVNVQENCGTLQIKGLRAGVWKEDLVPTPVDVQLQPGIETEISVEIVQNWEGKSGLFGYRLRGKIKSSEIGNGTVELPIRNPRDWAANLIVQELKRLGVNFRPAAEIPPNGKTRGGRAVVYSPTLAEIVHAINKPSNNLGAESLARSLGARLGPQGVGLVQAGEQVVAGHVRAVSVRIPESDFDLTQELKFMDGSGVSRMNRVSARAVLAYLVDLSEQKYFAQMWESLPIAGVDGTLASRMKGTAAAGVLRAKTGTLSGFYQLAGFVPARTGKQAYVPFVVLTETTSTNRLVARGAQDRVGAALAEILR